MAETMASLNKDTDNSLKVDKTIKYKDFSQVISSPSQTVLVNIGVAEYQVLSIVTTGGAAHRFAPLMYNTSPGSEQVYVSCGDATTIRWRVYYIKQGYLTSV